VPCALLPGLPDAFLDAGEIVFVGLWHYRCSLGSEDNIRIFIALAGILYVMEIVHIAR